MIMLSALQEIQKTLQAKAEKSNHVFFQKMVPGQQKIYGVKTPELNILAQKYKIHSFDLARELWESGALEEKIIAIKIIEKTGKQDPEQVLKLFKQFSKTIDNWAVCDGLGMQFLRGIVKTHAAEIFALASVYNHSKDPWQRRLSLVMVEWYTRKKEYTTDIKKLVKGVENDKEYYVKKAVVWLTRNFDKGK
jgi:3-methyladenine DNA glycosylase AlkD